MMSGSSTPHLKCHGLFGTIGYFVACYSISGLLTSTLAMYVNSQISTLERQFGLSSTESGILLSANEIGFICSILFTGYIAPRVHIPKFLAVSTILFGVSGLLCTVPYALTRLRYFNKGALLSANHHGDINNTVFTALQRQTFSLLCQGKNETNNTEEACSSEGRRNMGISQVTNEYPSLREAAVTIICVGMVVGTFVSHYVDENGQKQKTGWYLGIITTVSLLGPLLSYGLGGVFSRTYVTLEDVTFSPTDPRWIGAWWLGFLVFGFLSVIFALPLFLIPRKKERKIKEIQEKNNNENKVLNELKGMLKALWRVVGNPLYALLMIASIVQLLGVASYFSFLAKYMEYQFTIPVWHANYILGICMISAMCIGTFLGGTLTRKVAASPRNLIGIIFLLAVGSTIFFSFGFFLGCDSMIIAGPHIEGYTSTIQTCSEECDCGSVDYFPACGADGVTYFSPCYAGCSSSTGAVFQNCSCVNTSDQTLMAGPCDTKCPYLYPFAACNLLCSLISAMKIMPSLVTKMRIVGNEDKALAVSVASFAMSIFGWLPGPLLIGGFIDDSCSLWKKDCGHRGACALYDLNHFRFNMHIFPMAMRMFVVVLLGLAYIKVRKVTSWKDIQQYDSSTKEVNNETDVMLT